VTAAIATPGAIAFRSRTQRRSDVLAQPQQRGDFPLEFNFRQSGALRRPAPHVLVRV
jgi:hypothetical protein